LDPATAAIWLVSFGINTTTTTTITGAVKGIYNLSVAASQYCENTILK
jgi:hypothetical protein